MPNFTEENFRAITDLIVANKVWMILGADDAEPRPGATSHDDYDSFNAAFLFNRQGKVVATYHKQHLVVFGEYLPFARWLPFLRRVIPIPGDFTPGDRPVPFELDAVATVYDRRTHDGEVQGRRSQTAATGGERSKLAATTVVKLCVLICFEDVIPGLARESSGDDIDFMLNLTNDGWFGESAAQWQQAANAVFRAVENGLPLVRCTNNGLTCWIDSRGARRLVWVGVCSAVCPRVRHSFGRARSHSGRDLIRPVEVRRHVRAKSHCRHPIRPLRKISLRSGPFNSIGYGICLIPSRRS
ncbi:MAG: hypothetical protein DME24_06155 [Verrucomicrobia bacterium]|nr:MAG: hypothetical protein DME24_06155 [Verrucomicrobiota bacterium]